MSIENLPNNFYVQFYDNKCIAKDNQYYMQNDGNPLYRDIVANLTPQTIKNNLPADINADDILHISWIIDNPAETYFNLKNDGIKTFIANEENYNKFIKPYVDIWQEIKDKIEQEQEEQEKEYNKFENRQKRALTQLNQDFEDVKERAYIKSSLGFTSDADSTANENITGLLLTIGDNTIQFCDYYNEFHTLNKSQLTTLQNEIIQNAQNLYTQKWQYRTAIENATDNSTLDEAVSQINFTYMDFSNS